MMTSNIFLITNYEAKEKTIEKAHNTDRKEIMSTKRTSDGYTYCFRRYSTHNPEWGNFSSACHKIPEDED